MQRHLNSPVNGTVVKEKQLLEILNEGSEVWNEWKAGHTTSQLINLKNADLQGINLSGANLDGTDLSGANLSGASLCNTTLNDSELRNANLSNATLRYSNLCNTNLSGANLTNTGLIDANLNNARLVYALLCFADFSGAELKNADLMFAKFHGTMLTNTNLTAATGLEHSTHLGPSSLDHHTLEVSGKLPIHFLRGCGLSESLIDHLPLIHKDPAPFNASYICFSEEDKQFARRLHDELQGRGIRCWFDEQPFNPANGADQPLDQGSHLHKKILLVTSKDSLGRTWVDDKIKAVLQKEQQLLEQNMAYSGQLISLNLDDHLFSGSWQGEMAVEVESRLGADFSGWETCSDKFETALEKVIEALKPKDRIQF